TRTDTRSPDPGDDPVVRLDGVAKSYEEGGRTHTVLHDVDLSIARGEFVVLLGPSGSGKSTLLNLVAGIDQPDAGSIRIAGNELTGLEERERTLFRRAHLGFVFQFFNLLPTLTVEENLLLPVELKGRVDQASRDRARRLLERVGLANRADAFPDRLSGGEQQRIALCRALVHEPDLILADEPTGNLDPETGEKILDLLDELVRADGRTLLAVTHSRTLAARADRVLRIDGGRIVEADRELEARRAAAALNPQSP
ncbi:MAG TPA: ABC transporter ATP-binding protein, partial [Longimicrobiales bacterium]|nr:ABC transporter ATP-binding protein [Longimicrobiales bacterium]